MKTNFKYNSDNNFKTSFKCSFNDEYKLAYIIVINHDRNYDF